MMTVYPSRGDYVSPGAAIGNVLGAYMGHKAGAPAREQRAEEERKQKEEEFKVKLFFNALNKGRINLKGYKTTDDLVKAFRAGTVGFTEEPKTLEELLEQDAVKSLMGGPPITEERMAIGARAKRAAEGKPSRKQELVLAGQKAAEARKGVLGAEAEPPYTQMISDALTKRAKISAEAGIKARTKYAESIAKTSGLIAEQTAAGTIKGRAGQLSLLKKISGELEAVKTTAHIKARLDKVEELRATKDGIEATANKIKDRKARMEYLKYAYNLLDKTWLVMEAEGNSRALGNLTETLNALSAVLGVPPIAVTHEHKDIPWWPDVNKYPELIIPEGFELE